MRKLVCALCVLALSVVAISCDVVNTVDTAIAALGGKYQIYSYDCYIKLGGDNVNAVGPQNAPTCVREWVTNGETFVESMTLSGVLDSAFADGTMIYEKERSHQIGGCKFVRRSTHIFDAQLDRTDVASATGKYKSVIGTWAGPVSHVNRYVEQIVNVSGCDLPPESSGTEKTVNYDAFVDISEFDDVLSITATSEGEPLLDLDISGHSIVTEEVI